MSAPAPEWTLPRVFAHRCGGSLAPENTLAGLPVASAMGIRAVEFDVMLSADRTPWLIHDEALERTTNGAGLVCEQTDSALRELDAGLHRHRSFAGELLPTFEAAVRLCQRLGLLVNVEIKPAAGHEAQTGEVVARQILALWDAQPLPLVSSFSEEALLAARRVAPQLPIGVLWEQPPTDWRARGAALNAFSMHCEAAALADSVIGEAREAGIPVLCYTVNDRGEAESLLARGVSAVFSDRIDRMRDL